MTSYPPTSAEGAGLHCMTGFLAGEAAEAAGRMRQSEVVRQALAQLDQMFGTPDVPVPVTNLLRQRHVALPEQCKRMLAVKPAQYGVNADLPSVCNQACLFRH